MGSVRKKPRDDTYGFISGSMGCSIDSAMNPAVLVQDVIELLVERYGANVVLEAGAYHTATIAAADLLRAVGVRPESAPASAPKALRRA